MTARRLAIALFLVAWSAQPARAAEGGFSFYLPGTAGDIALAQSREPGWQVANTVFVQIGDGGAAVLQGKLNLGLDLTLVLDFISASYTFERKLLGATYTVGAAIPFGYAELEATIGSFVAQQDSFALADIALVPLELSWTIEDLSLQLGTAIYAPAGEYDVDDVVNLGLNHWGFDFAFAATYFNQATGTEISAAPGFLLNTTNDETDYRTGTEFHLDFTVNQFLAETFAIGVRGYYYNQFTGDSGSGAILGDFEGESVGLGPGFIWFPKFAEGKLAVLGKWIHDFKSTNRFESGFGTFTIAWTF